MVDWKRTRYLYGERGLLVVVGPMGREAAGSGRFRVSEQVWRGRYKRSMSGHGRVIVYRAVVSPLFEYV
jgi:hypothetical protein